MRRFWLLLAVMVCPVAAVGVFADNPEPAATDGPTATAEEDRENPSAELLKKFLGGGRLTGSVHLEGQKIEFELENDALNTFLGRFASCGPIELKTADGPKVAGAGNLRYEGTLTCPDGQTLPFRVWESDLPQRLLVLVLDASEPLGGRRAYAVDSYTDNQYLQQTYRRLAGRPDAEQDVLLLEPLKRSHPFSNDKEERENWMFNKFLQTNRILGRLGGPEGGYRVDFQWKDQDARRFARRFESSCRIDKEYLEDARIIDPAGRQYEGSFRVTEYSKESFVLWESNLPGNPLIVVLGSPPLLPFVRDDREAYLLDSFTANFAAKKQLAEAIARSKPWPIDPMFYEPGRPSPEGRESLNLLNYRNHRTEGLEWVLTSVQLMGKVHEYDVVAGFNLDGDTCRTFTQLLESAYPLDRREIERLKLLDKEGLRCEGVLITERGGKITFSLYQSRLEGKPWVFVIEPVPMGGFTRAPEFYLIDSHIATLTLRSYFRWIIDGPTSPEDPSPQPGVPRVISYRRDGAVPANIH